MLRRLCNTKIPFSGVLFALLTPGLFAAIRSVSVGNGALHVEMTSTGAYKLRSWKTGWSFAGKLGVPAEQIKTTDGTDTLGTYKELSFIYGPADSREGSFRIYADQSTIVMKMRVLKPVPNTPGDAAPFPDFASGPNSPGPPALHQLGFQVVPFGTYRFGYLGPQGPWVLFDSKANTLIVSPANDFFVANLQRHGSGFYNSITPKVQTLPAGFTQETVLVIDSGVNRTFARWGHAMQKLSGRTAPSNEADVLLQKLSYWTDNGASYYYRFDDKLGYAGTLEAVRNKFAQLGLPLGSMQIDSWFYPKGPNADWRQHHWDNGAGGAYLYEADKQLFPNGLGAFSHTTQLPLITHGRWIDASSPYRKTYAMSGNVIIDPRYWQRTADWLHAANVATYEQDWLSEYGQAATNLTDPQKYHDLMAQAMQRDGLTMQYCMPAPADYLQGARYDNLTTIRTSGDRFDRSNWDSFLYDSRLASALGIWPWTDVFRSGELSNLFLSTLSAGPVGVGDSLDAIDIPNLLRAVRADGIIVKPDVPIRPLDRIYLADAENTPTPMVASTWTEHESGSHVLRTTYVFSYARHREANATLRAKDFSYSGSLYVYDWRTGHGKLLPVNGSYTLPLTDGWGYAVLAPIGRSGMAIIGDASEITTAGRQRIPEISDNGQLHVTVNFAPRKSPQTILIYAPHPPQASVGTGQIRSQSYDPTTRLFQLTVAANSGQQAIFEVGMRAGKTFHSQR